MNHIPVLLTEALSYLNVKPRKWYVDATVGLGGHTESILNQQGRVIGIDQDQTALTHTKKHLPSPFLTLIHGNFKDILTLVRSVTSDPIDGILFDFGVSSLQLDTPSRGFSFLTDAPLDMRQNQASNVTAAEVVNHLSESALSRLFVKNGETKYAFSLARAICQARQIKPIQTTSELTQIILATIPRTGHLHPATKIFQALRIYVNQEENNLRQGLTGALQLVGQNGRVVTITFHEGEDRPVKQLFKNQASAGAIRILTKKAIKPGVREIQSNPRARSAKLRAIERL